MNYAQLVARFLNHADELDRSTEQSAVFRAANYRVAANKLSSMFKATQRVTPQTLETSGLTPYMQGRALQFLHGTSAKATTKPSTVSHKSSKSMVSKEKCIAQFAAISGLGAKRAAEFYARGARTIADLLKDPQLPVESRIFIEMQPLERIPRAIIDQFNARLQRCVAQYNVTHKADSVEMHITGSYRRGAATSGDIDICFIGQKNMTIDVAVLLLRTCFGRNNVRVYSHGPEKTAMIIIIDDVRVKVDVWFSTKETSAAMILYTTGSKQSNIAMRAQAKRLGMLLNQEGLFHDGQRIETHTEKDFYRALKLAYLEPHER